MKVLMQARPDIFTDTGGDTTQLIKTREALQSLGIEVDVSTEEAPDLTNYDIVHLFNLKLVESTYLQFCNAKKYNKPVALSVIYWKMSEEEMEEMKRHLLSAYGENKTLLLQKAKDKIKAIEALFPLISFYTRIANNKRYRPKVYYELQKQLGETKMQLDILKGADILLPNSYSEMNLLYKDFGISKDHLIVPNAVDVNTSKTSPSLFLNKYCIKDFILCAARIEERKNQLNVIRAIKNDAIPLVLVGNGREPYLSACKKEAGANVFFLGHLEGEMLLSAYSAAKVHILASWYETPGLSSLEAALNDCNIVVSTKGATKEYFDVYAEYCEPNDIGSIRGAILRAFNKAPSQELVNVIKSQYTWNKAACKTMEAYNKIFKERRH